MLGNRPEKKRQKGFATIYLTLVGAFLLIPMAGLAIDFGIVYNVKARLQTACDAAAIGAGYLLHATTNLSDTTQYNAITGAAQQFFNANFTSNYMGSSLGTYTAVATSSTAGKTITVNATAYVPMLFMRVLGIAHSTVSAEAVSNVRYIAMMIVVDRSGSVVLEGAGPTIQSALTTFVANSSTSYLVNGVDTVGMVSFGGQWNLDFSPSTNFQSGQANTIGTAITNIPFDSNSSTNTAEGLYQAWYQLYQMNLPGSLNVIVLLTDGRPSAFTSNWTPNGTTTCTNKAQRGGVFETYVGLGSYPFWPPPTSGNDSTGLYATQFTSVPETNNLAQDSTNCYYDSSTANVYKDFSGGTFPASVGPVDHVGSGTGYPPGFGTAGTGLSTLSGYYTVSSQSMQDPEMGRYAAFNAADHMATLIRQDTTLQPMMFVIGLNYSGTATEPLDADWLARVANDPNYQTTGTDSNAMNGAGVTPGHSVYQSGQTPGMYCNSTTTTLATCFAQVTNALLRLTQ
jgi:Flp pilus assembly protein TadG